jgi:hypothetical protein
MTIAEAWPKRILAVEDVHIVWKLALLFVQNCSDNIMKSGYPPRAAFLHKLTHSGELAIWINVFKNSVIVFSDELNRKSQIYIPEPGERR